MKTVGILQQPRIEASAGMAEEIAVWLAEQGIRNWTAAPIDNELDLDEELAGSDMLIVLGGDGSTLRAARMTVPHGVPLFVINLGRVGFLSEAEPENWEEKLQKVVDGEYWIERRLLIRAELWRDDEEVQQFVSLNEIVLGRGAQARVIRLHLKVDGDLVTTYIADALIIATPTGSTAYAMAAGGPLMPPQLHNIVVVPVAAHLSLNRSLVLHEEAKISVGIEMSHEAYLTSDGQTSAQLHNGDQIIVTRYEKDCCFVRVETPGYFYRRLMERLGFSWPHL